MEKLLGGLVGATNLHRRTIKLGHEIAPFHNLEQARAIGLGLFERRAEKLVSSRLLALEVE